MKTVFSNNYDVIHKFAQRTQYEGRSSNVFFEGDRLYSYGRHYILAQFLGQNDVLIGDRGYSSSTAKHISITIQATRQYTQWYETTSDPDIVWRRLNNIKKALLKARKPEKYISEALSIIEKYTQFCSRFDKVISKENQEIISFFTTNAPELAEKISELVKEQKMKRATIIEQYKDAFYNFEPFDRLKFEAGLDYDLLRVNGTQLETSQNIKVDLIEAEKLYRAYVSGLPIVGQKIEGYTILKATPEIIKIGCHNIKPLELANIFEGVTA
jgi:hypothetical protein